MIKNNRPYSIENGYIDDGLITSHSKEEIETVNKWIDENIAPNKKNTSWKNKLWDETYSQS